MPILDLNDLAAELVRVYRCNTETSREDSASTKTLNPCLGDLSKISKRNMIMRIDVLFSSLVSPFYKIASTFSLFHYFN